MRMPLAAIATGALLIAVNLVVFLFSESRSLTQFIPSLFGLLLLVAGVVAVSNQAAAKHAMHAALLVAVLGVIGPAGRVGSVLARGGEVSQLALIANLLLAALCLAFLILGVRHFLKVRRDRKAGLDGSRSTPVAP